MMVNETMSKEYIRERAWDYFSKSLEFKTNANGEVRVSMNDMYFGVLLGIRIVIFPCAELEELITNMLDRKFNLEGEGL